MGGNLRSVMFGAVFGLFAGILFVVSGCGSSGAGLPFRQVDRTGKPGLEVLFMADNAIINAFNFLSPAGDKFNLDTEVTGSVHGEYVRVITAFAALACSTGQAISNPNIKPFNQVCPATTFGAGAAPADFVAWVKTSVIPEFEGTFLPDVLRLDTDQVFANRDVLRYAYDIGTSQFPLVCKNDSPRTYCGGRRFGEDALRFDYSMLLLGTTGTTQPALLTVEDDGVTTGSTIAATFPYLEVPGT